MKPTTVKSKDMKKTTVPMEAVIENQNKLVETFTNNAMKAMDIFKMEDNWSKKSKEFMLNYMKEQKELMEKAMQPASYDKGIESMTEQMTKVFEMNFNYANKAMDMYREMLNGMMDSKQENPMNRMFELFNDNVHAMMDASKKNMEAMRNMNLN